MDKVLTRTLTINCNGVQCKRQRTRIVVGNTRYRVGYKDNKGQVVVSVDKDACDIAIVHKVVNINLIALFFVCVFSFFAGVAPSDDSRDIIKYCYQGRLSMSGDTTVTVDFEGYRTRNIDAGYRPVHVACSEGSSTQTVRNTATVAGIAVVLIVVVVALVVGIALSILLSLPINK